MLEKTSFWSGGRRVVSRWLMVGAWVGGWWGNGMERGGTYGIVDDFVAARVVVDVDCDAAEGGDFGSEFVEAGVVLSGRCQCCGPDDEASKGMHVYLSRS